MYVVSWNRPVWGETARGDRLPSERTFNDRDEAIGAALDVARTKANENVVMKVLSDG